MTKAEIRSCHKNIRDSLAPKLRSDWSEAILTKLLRTAVYRKCEYVFTYVSFRTEVATEDIIKQALAEHKKVYVPKVEADGMEFYQIFSLGELVPGSLNIPEPEGNADRRYKIREAGQEGIYNKLMLLPGLAFDRNGSRIGYGAGYYDRYLSGCKEEEFYKLGLAYDIQLREDIPADVHDIKADAVLTPTQYIPCKEIGVQSEASDK